MEKLIEIIDKKLDEFMQMAEPEIIWQSMRYSVLAKGKRLRPVMCLEACRMFSESFEKAIPTACAIEMLHAQSLIHDDLPCMDNDDYRRGKLTNHKVYGDAIAVLAGDALLSFAPQIIIQKSDLPAEIKLRLVEEFSVYAGALGLIAGQTVDIQSEGGFKEAKSQDELKNILNFIHEHKTADLFKLALKSGAIIAGANEKQIKLMENFALRLGLAFQICDDILDEISSFEEMGKTLGKDKTANKLTYTALYGLENSKCKLNCLLDDCCDILKSYDLKSDILSEIIENIRKKAYG